MKKFLQISFSIIAVSFFVLFPLKTKAALDFTTSIVSDFAENAKAGNDGTKLYFKYSSTAVSGTTKTSTIKILTKDDVESTGELKDTNTTYVKFYDQVGWGTNGSEPYHRKSFYEKVGSEQVTKRNSLFVLLYNAVPKQIDTPNDLIKGTLVSWQEVPLKINTPSNEGTIFFSGLEKGKKYIPEILLVNKGYGPNLINIGSPVQANDTGSNIALIEPFVSANLTKTDIGHKFCTVLQKYAANGKVTIVRGTYTNGVMVPGTPAFSTTKDLSTGETLDLLTRKQNRCAEIIGLVPNTEYVVTIEALVTDDPATESAEDAEKTPFSIKLAMKTFSNGNGADISKITNTTPTPAGESSKITATKLNDNTYNVCGIVAQTDKVSNVEISLTRGVLDASSSTPFVKPDFDNTTITKKGTDFNIQNNTSTKVGNYCANFGSILPGNYVFKMHLDYTGINSVDEYKRLFIGGLNPNRIPIVDSLISTVWSKKNNAFVVTGKITNLSPNDKATIFLVKKGTFDEILPKQEDMDGFSTADRIFVLNAKFRNLPTGLYSAVVRPLHSDGTPFINTQGRIERVSEEFETENIKKISPDDTLGGGTGNENGGGNNGSGGGIFDGIGEDITVPSGGFVLCGRPGQPACDFDMLMLTVNKFINYALTLIATPIMLWMLFKTSFEFFTAGGNVVAMATAKRRLLAVIIGYAIALAAWLLIKTVIMLLVGEDALSGVDPVFKTFFNS